MSIEKWKRAVIHLECAADSINIYDRADAVQSLRRQLDDHAITEDQFIAAVSAGWRDLRIHGTAIFLTHDSRRYLVTARHVLHDERTAGQQVESEEKRIQQFNIPWAEDHLRREREYAQSRAYDCILRVPTIEDLLNTDAGNDPPAMSFITNLNAGPYSMAPYTFSSRETDLAIISLDKRYYEFGDYLQYKGHEPVTLDDIAAGPSTEGAEVFTVGYPTAMAIIAARSLDWGRAMWESSLVSLPTLSFGRVSMHHERLWYFWADMSIYPGSSGGPVVEDGKLIGIVIAQPTIPVEGTQDLHTRIPFARVIKGVKVKDLVLEQQNKDRLSPDRPRREGSAGFQQLLPGQEGT